ncbi:DUF4173 domain-containing protein [Pedobacter sp. UBA4863]|uniref:DUF4153 domain-containing protein n=1 Tax=Pedobacter sp. UBA4863 TaxID=1947060 RepID=UPI0025CC5E28|nr:DUF4173 domain-containing protein [Pedobacter sp. UBA4863]
MKQQIDYRLPLIFIGGLIFQYLFWKEFLGINLLIYTLFIFIITLTDKGIPFHKNKVYTALPHLSIAIYISYNNSILATITWFITLFIYLGTLHFPLLKSAVTAMLLGILQAVSGPYGIFSKLQATKLGTINFKPVIKPIKYIVLPLLMVIIFCTLYSTANPIFAKYTQLIADSIAQFLTQIFNFLFIDISIPKCLFILWGIFIKAGLIVGIKSKLLAEIELEENDQLTRKRSDKKTSWFLQDFRILLAGNQTQKSLALKTENTVGIICFIMLNLLLMLLNGIDIYTLWLNNVVTTKNFSAALHDGTNTLIFSIVIAILIIVYFFSGNLNFYKQNKWIKLLAYIWIAQNAFLVASVFHRDYDYIFYHGLTYKRIGVAVFATLSLVGLVTVYLKVAQQKTVFYLYRLNAKVWYLLIIVLSFINWDVFIVRYNLAKADKIGIDVDHLMTLSDKTLPILNENRDFLLRHVVIETESNKRTYGKTETADSVVKLADSEMIKPQLSDAELKAQRIKQAKDYFNQELDNRIDRFLKQQKSVSWLSFSYLEWKAVENLKKTN